MLYNATRAASQPELKSDLAGGYCLTDDNNGGAGSLVSAYLCNGGADQYFSTRSAANGPELAVGAGCLVPQGSSSTRLGGPDVAIGSCGSSTADAAWGGLWTTGTSGDGNRYYRNNRTGECLHATAGSSVTVAACDTGAASMQWIPSTYSSSGTPPPTPGTSTGCYGKTLALGASGSCVTDAQIIVAFAAPGQSMVVNGSFGTPTQSAVELFQKIAVSGNGVTVGAIPVTGKIDTATWGKLCTVGTVIATSTARIESPPLTGPYYNVRDAAINAGCPN